MWMRMAWGEGMGGYPSTTQKALIQSLVMNMWPTIIQVSVIVVHPFLLAMEAGQLNSDVDEDVPEIKDDGPQRPTESFDPFAGYEYVAYNNTGECHCSLSIFTSHGSRPTLLRCG